MEAVKTRGTNYSVLAWIISKRFSPELNNKFGGTEDEKGLAKSKKALEYCGEKLVQLKEDCGAEDVEKALEEHFFKKYNITAANLHGSCRYEGAIKELLEELALR